LIECPRSTVNITQYQGSHECKTSIITQKGKGWLIMQFLVEPA
jgi:hypothetical protein